MEEEDFYQYVFDDIEFQSYSGIFLQRTGDSPSYKFPNQTHRQTHRQTLKRKYTSDPEETFLKSFNQILSSPKESLNTGLSRGKNGAYNKNLSCDQRKTFNLELTRKNSFIQNGPFDVRYLHEKESPLAKRLHKSVPPKGFSEGKACGKGFSRPQRDFLDIDLINSKYKNIGMTLSRDENDIIDIDVSRDGHDIIVVDSLPDKHDIIDIDLSCNKHKVIDIESSRDKNEVIDIDSSRDKHEFVDIDSSLDKNEVIDLDSEQDEDDLPDKNVSNDKFDEIDVDMLRNERKVLNMLKTRLSPGNQFSSKDAIKTIKFFTILGGHSNIENLKEETIKATKEHHPHPHSMLGHMFELISSIYEEENSSTGYTIEKGTNSMKTEVREQIMTNNNYINGKEHVLPSYCSFVNLIYPDDRKK